MGECTNKYRYLLLIALFFGGLFTTSQSVIAQPIAEKGIIDLRTINFEDFETLALKGDWEFYWNELIEPSGISSISNRAYTYFPDLWNNNDAASSFGYATYALTILLPKSYPELALSIPDLYTSYNLYINNELIASNGKVAKTRSEYVPKWLPTTVSLSKFSQTELHLTLQVANFDHFKGGGRLPINLGLEKDLARIRDLKLGYAFTLTGSLIMGGLFFLGLYLFGRNEKPILYFSLFCLTYSYRIIGTGLYPLHLLLIDIPWIYTIRAEYLALYISPVFFGLFLKHQYPKESSIIVIRIFHSIFLLLSLVSLILPPYYFTQYITYFFIIGPIYIVYATWVFTLAVINKRQGSIYAISSGVVLFCLFILNLLEYYVIVKENLLISLVGYLSFFFLQSLILSERFGLTLTKAKEQAEYASLAKSQFLSTMGHELRTPLNAVIGFSELIVDSKSPKERTEFATTIKKSGESLLGIINNILDYSKIESQDIILENQPIHLRSYLEDITKMLSALTIYKNIELKSEINIDTEFIETDSVRLRQVLINLIGNAVKFTKEGTITVAINQIQDSSNDIENYHFSVNDTGIGVSQDKLGLLFHQFYQVDADKNRKYGGTGLGLTISKRIVEQMGGKIWVESAEGVGTTFHFTLQAKAALPFKLTPSNNKPRKKTSESNTLKILIAEDNIINQKVAQKVLERLGYSSDIANDGFAAIEKVQQIDYDIVFMDMEMPGLDGIETTQKIFELNLAKTPIIIAMTALVSNDDQERCYLAGMRGFIAKPITLESVRNAINKHFDT
ncbi:MAG: ATP-binding protein [Balneolaceae bacterium]